MSRRIHDVRIYLDQLEASGNASVCEEPLAAIAAQLRHLAESAPPTDRAPVDAPEKVSPPDDGAEPPSSRTVESYVGLYQRTYLEATQRNTAERLGTTHQAPFEPATYYTPVSSHPRYGVRTRVSEPVQGQRSPSPAATPDSPFRGASRSSAAAPVAPDSGGALRPQHTQAARAHANVQTPPMQASASAASPSALHRPSTTTRPHLDPPRAPAADVRLPNANAGRPYDAELRDLLTTGGRIVVRDLPDGLRIDHGHLLGAPTAAGEYRIEWEQDGTGQRGALLLTVNADPRSLWLDKPSDRNDRYWKPDAAGEMRESPTARAVVASVRGRSHAHVGSFRDDDFVLGLEDIDDAPLQRWNILVVADGAGGAKYSRRGSQIACQVVKRRLSETLCLPDSQEVAEFLERACYATEADKADHTFWSPRLYRVLVPAIAEAQAAVRSEAESVGASKKDFHTTLLVAIVRQTTSGAWFVGTYWIGDGAIGMWDDTWSAPKIFGEADSGEFAGETTFLTHEDFGKPEVVNRRLRYSIVPSFSYLALMTDGISDPKFDAETKLKSADVWRTFTRDLCSASPTGVLEDIDEAALLEWMNFWSPGNHDDRTLLIFQPRAHAGGDA